MSDPQLARPLLEWYARARRDLPWRATRDPYAVWVSETMLQQTRVQTVLPYYERFMRELPTVGALAEAPESRVLALWSGLGYYRRARMLQAAARRVASEHAGRIPAEPEALRRLEGVGAYTAGAIASIAYRRRAPLVDGNVARVLARLFVVGDDVRGPRGQARLWEIAARLIEALGADADPGDWNQALMELGATVCVPRAPRCADCPVAAQCRAREQGRAAELPHVGAKARPKEAERSAVVLASEDAVLLARRRPGSLWGGLWEPPGVPGPLSELAEALGVDPAGLEPAGTVTHVLTHRRLRVEVARGALPERAPWPVPPDYDAVAALSWRDVEDLPHSALARKMLIVAKLPFRGLPWKK